MAAVLVDEFEGHFLDQEEIDVSLYEASCMLQSIAALVLVYKIWKEKTVYGICFDTQLCFLLAVIGRLYWANGTRLTDWTFSYVEVAVGILSAAAVCVLCHKFRHTALCDDAPGGGFTIGKILIIAAISSGLVSFFRFYYTGRIKSYSLNILTGSFSMWLEAFALLPQLHLMRRQPYVESLTSHYVALLAGSRVLRLAVWGLLCWRGETDVFVMFGLPDVVHTLLAADYMALWWRNFKMCGPMMLV